MAPALTGKRALIVGGTSGIGLATAARFLDEGAAVVVAGLDAADAVRQLAPHGPAHVVATDVREPRQVADLFAATLDRLGGLDILFHVAGASGRRHGDGPLHECTADGWLWTLQTNLTGVFLTNQAAVRHWLAVGQGGVILNTGSVLATDPAPEHFDTCAYAAAKGGLVSLSRLAAARYAAHGIRVNVLAPGLIETPMAQRAVGDAAIRAFLEKRQPLFGGPGRPQDCAEAAVFLCSDAARGITGVVLPVDGGWTVG